MHIKEINQEDQKNMNNIYNNVYIYLYEINRLDDNFKIKRSDYLSIRLFIFYISLLLSSELVAQNSIIFIIKSKF